MSSPTPGSKEHLPLFCVMAVIAAAFKFKQWQSSTLVTSPEFKKFQFSYLAVILFMKTADWLQGPYVYALYRNYGYSSEEIGYLFIAGFGVSGIVGVAVGNFADKNGRKAGCILFTILYCCACICYHFNNFQILLIGRACAGLGTALLYSVFEAWYKSEHERLGFDPAWMSDTFNKQTFGDAVLAIAAGLIASLLADYFGDIGAFDASMVCLIIGGILIVTTWQENYAAKEEGQDDTSIAEVLATMWANPEIALCGCVQSLFGGSMYIFVYMWTPSLPDHYNPGIIFSCFMVSIMIGTCVFSELMARKWTLSGCVVLVCGLGAVLLVIPALTPMPEARLAAFVLYEVVIGIWFPSYHSMRAHVVPDRGHATILSFYRLPLNIIVVLIIMNNHRLSTTQVFSMTFAMLSVAVFLMSKVHKILTTKAKEAEEYEMVEGKKDK